MNLRAMLGQLSISSRGLSRYQWLANPLKLFHGYSPFPLNLDLMLTIRCNLNCITCINTQEKNAKSLSAFKQPEMPPTAWQDIIRDTEKAFFFKPNINLLGGEPSLYKGYLDIAAFAKQRGFRFSYTTNGVFLARDAAAIVSSGVDVVVVSLDGPRELHDSIRGAGVYDTAIEGIRALNAAKRAQGRLAPQVFLNCVISGHNSGQFSQVVDIAQGLDVNCVVYLHFRFPDSEMGAHEIDVARVVQEIEKGKLKAEKNNIALNFCPFIETDEIATYYQKPGNELGHGCVSPWLRMIVTPNGQVIACRHHVVGDLKTSDVKSVWNGSPFRAFRRSLARSGTFPDCERCGRKQYRSPWGRK
jgi:MoaA/NifB/PqqE/SkfB family radical SAM enzyme